MSDQGGLLAGIRVLELGEGIAAPYATQLLAHLGADVVKVERPQGDWLRDTARASFLVVDKNKQCVCLDAKSRVGRDLLWRLIDGSDVLITNFRGPALERLECSWETVHVRAPHVVFGQISAYGTAGPMSGEAGSDTVMQAVSGLMSQVGRPGDDPTRVSFPVVDLVAGRDLAIGVLAALIHRGTRMGLGRHVRVSLFAAASSLLLEAWQHTLLYGFPPGRVGNLNMAHAPSGVYKCSDGSMLAVILLRNAEWEPFCALLGQTGFGSDKRYATNDDRVREYEVLQGMVAKQLARRPASEWVEMFGAANILCGKVNSLSDIAAQPDLFALVPLVTTFSEGDVGTGRALGVPIEVDGMRTTVPAAGALGKDGRRVLRGLGFSDREIDNLVACKAVILP